MLLDDFVVPILASGHFSNLRSLHLYWEGPGSNDITTAHVAHIFEESLPLIETITTLEQLCIGAGNRFGWRKQWLVNHEAIRTHFQHLAGLRKLALRRDTYTPQTPGFDPEDYYQDRYNASPSDAIVRSRSDLDEQMNWFQHAQERMRARKMFVNGGPNSPYDSLN